MKLVKTNSGQEGVYCLDVTLNSSQNQMTDKVRGKVWQSDRRTHEYFKQSIERISEQVHNTLHD